MPSDKYFHYNDTSQLRSSWYAPDLDGSRLRETRQILKICATTSFAIGTFVFLLTSLRLWEDRHTFRVRDPAHKTRSFVVAFFYSNLAAPLVIWLNVTSWTLSASTILTTIVDEQTCVQKQMAASGTYTFSLATTYALFEIRRMSTGVKFKGVKHLLATLVRLGTCSMPIFPTISAVATSGYFIQELDSCTLSVHPTIALLFVLGDSTLSIGHLLVFIFALQRHTNVKIFPETKSKVIRSSPSSNAGIGLHNTSQETNEKIQRIARRNFHLALVSTISTFAAVGFTALVNSTTPALDEIGYETAFYLRKVNTIILTFDLPINSFACLLMTPQWQPKIFKRALAVSVRGPTGMTPGPMDESDVSTLGGS